MKLHKGFWGIGVAAVLALLPTTGVAATVDSGGVEDVSEEYGDLYNITISEDAIEPSYQDLNDVAATLGSTLVAVKFDGDAGVGQVVLVKGETLETFETHAAALFETVNADVPPIVGGVVESAQPITEATVEAARGTFDVEAMPEPQSSADIEQAAEATSGALAAAVSNDWSPYFPSDWRAEAVNLNRCTWRYNGDCWEWLQLATLTQSITWSDDHSPSLWPSSEWGFEFGVALHNYSYCDDNPDYAQGYWLNAGLYEWGTNMGGANVYADDNRAFDDCGVLSHELGVRSPQNLTAGYQYAWTVAAPRNPDRPDNSYSAQFQAVHDDCIGDWSNYADCMGLNQNITWPFGGDRSETVINIDRGFLFPKCSRMHDKWSAPRQWSNGGAILMPAPLNYYDTCFSNDW
ncbi:hypothetical protein ACEXQE_09685 [Herbiconiux sp. P17]|uniref:hypothetical protein n=1 Tax=Herbiconiux wuyangfengii TaxID=3342794 RepID=UPI0035BAA07F